MKFRDIINVYDDLSPFILNETLDSSYPINRTETEGNVWLYYITIADKNYRIFIERINNDLHIGFERFNNDAWEIDIITNDLKASELLGIFGTIKNLLLKETFNSVYVFTGNSKKKALYSRLIQKLRDKLNIELKLDFKFASKNDVLFIYSDVVYKPTKFKYKIQKF